MHMMYRCCINGLRLGGISELQSDVLLVHYSFTDSEIKATAKAQVLEILLSTVEAVILFVWFSRAA